MAAAGLAWAVALLIASPAVGAAAGLADRYVVSVVTMGPGPSLFTRFGHTALLVTDTSHGLEKLYNFGEFDYGDPDLARKFVTGEIRYWASVGGFGPMRAQYRKGVRSLTVQTLALSETEIDRLRGALDRAVLPENRDYAYHHYRMNCSTKVRDLIDAATGGLLSASHGRPDRTFRHHTRRSLSEAPALRILFELILSAWVDQSTTRFDAAYLPERLARDIAAAERADGTPLVRSTERLFPDRRALTGGRWVFWGALFGSAALLGLLLASPFLTRRGRAGHRLFGAGLILLGTTAGLVGALLVALWVVTPYAYLHANQNILLFPPTHLSLAAVGARVAQRGRLSVRAAKALAFYAALSAGLLVSSLLLTTLGQGQDNLSFLVAAGAYLGIIAAVAVRRLGPSATPAVPSNRGASHRRVAHRPRSGYASFRPRGRVSSQRFFRGSLGTRRGLPAGELSHGIRGKNARRRGLFLESGTD